MFRRMSRRQKTAVLAKTGRCGAILTNNHTTTISMTTTTITRTISTSSRKLGASRYTLRMNYTLRMSNYTLSTSRLSSNASNRTNSSISHPCNTTSPSVYRTSRQTSSHHTFSATGNKTDSVAARGSCDGSSVHRSRIHSRPALSSLPPKARMTPRTTGTTPSYPSLHIFSSGSPRKTRISPETSPTAISISSRNPRLISTENPQRIADIRRDIHAVARLTVSPRAIAVTLKIKVGTTKSTTKPVTTCLCLCSRHVRHSTPTPTAFISLFLGSHRHFDLRILFSSFAFSICILYHYSYHTISTVSIVFFPLFFESLILFFGSIFVFLLFFQSRCISTFPNCLVIRIHRGSCGGRVLVL
ncbi:uncharacterized protein BT62DRAFT_730542 [Guyanagaster necrorhizus]|uniref:Uncharacterized protein n=1 Tax=Guyanagaster necrorhizus TaxID=856835 RepID=A0A9P7VYZ4_9AGAR|nr:uncharacterized protein BT62DRAFT_730542 [Guyanagaster necrorhizus MCA 3950]KAG7448844.1 hypothetical protein BT62DRAFT_730542 [Guyanagaster necrorhizus MCA 3950]